MLFGTPKNSKLFCFNSLTNHLGIGLLKLRSSADNRMAGFETLRGLSGVDPLILREFREAVDYGRKAAWVVQEEPLILSEATLDD